MKLPDYIYIANSSIFCLCIVFICYGVDQLRTKIDHNKNQIVQLNKKITQLEKDIKNDR